MVFKFRRSMKIAPGIRINVTHRGAGVRVGPKGAGYSVNTSGKQTLSGGIPGSGIHVSETISPGRRKRSKGGGGRIGTFLVAVLVIGILLTIVGAFSG